MLHIGDTTIGVPFTQEQAQQLDAAFQQLLKTVRRDGVGCLKISSDSIRLYPRTLTPSANPYLSLSPRHLADRHHPTPKTPVCREAESGAPAPLGDDGGALWGRPFSRRRRRRGAVRGVLQPQCARDGVRGEAAADDQGGCREHRDGGAAERDQVGPRQLCGGCLDRGGCFAFWLCYAALCSAALLVCAQAGVPLCHLLAEGGAFVRVTCAYQWMIKSRATAADHTGGVKSPQRVAWLGGVLVYTSNKVGFYEPTGLWKGVHEMAAGVWWGVGGGAGEGAWGMEPTVWREWVASALTYCRNFIAVRLALGHGIVCTAFFHHRPSNPRTRSITPTSQQQQQQQEQQTALIGETVTDSHETLEHPPSLAPHKTHMQSPHPPLLVQMAVGAWVGWHRPDDQEQRRLRDGGVLRQAAAKR